MEHEAGGDFIIKSKKSLTFFHKNFRGLYLTPSVDSFTYLQYNKKCKIRLQAHNFAGYIKKIKEKSQFRCVKTSRSLRLTRPISTYDPRHGIFPQTKIARNPQT